MTRRDFLKNSALGVGGATAAMLGLQIVNPKELFAAVAAEKGTTRWAFLVDTYKCVGCGMCVKACKTENEIPWEANASRTWVERYVITKDGKRYADSPKAARDGFTNPKIDLGEGHEVEVKAEDIDKAFFVPKLCNQCEDPACVQACPVGATYQVPDGVVLIDRKWCIGCGYCIMACPYGVRFFNPVTHTAEKCTFCYHRISQGLKPACVDACAFGARKIGNLKDPDDPVTKIIKTERVGVLKSDFGTKPQVFYIGLDEEVK
ncbi:MAG: 4Fe-4S dicluster domain-containing protein [Spirochaetota bacterium]